ncbi:hypothetical protein HDU76_012039, partial [Blyttiomyces sp. JEL0837]
DRYIQLFSSQTMSQAGYPNSNPSQTQTQPQPQPTSTNSNPSQAQTQPRRQPAPNKHNLLPDFNTAFFTSALIKAIHCNPKFDLAH